MSSSEDLKLKKPQATLTNTSVQISQQQAQTIPQQNVVNTTPQQKTTRIGILPSENIKEKQVSQNKNNMSNHLYCFIFTFF